MNPQSPEKVSINSHEVTYTQNASLALYNCPSNLTNNNSNSHQARFNNPSRIIFGQINVSLIRNKFEQLIYFFNKKIDNLIVSEAKLDDTFPVSVFNAILLNSF